MLRGTDGGDVLTGTQFRDDLHGGAGNDVLNGAGADDRLYGGEGDDIYVVSDPSQQVIELAGGGDDTVRSGSHRYVLGENVERLELLDGAYEGTGNQGNNTLIGNQGDNRLDGQAGEDRLVGGGGDDTYVVDSAGDVVIEVAGEGIDTVESALDWQLGDHLENLVLTGSGNLSGVGNSRTTSCTAMMATIGSRVASVLIVCTVAWAMICTSSNRPRIACSRTKTVAWIPSSAVSRPT